MLPVSAPIAPVFECRTLRTFNRAFLRLPESRAYAALALAAALTSVYLGGTILDVCVPVATVILGYPAFEYVLHRFVLHATDLCRTPLTARLWWRIHYRHHTDPRDARVILAAPWTLLFAVLTGALLATSMWWTLAGFAGALSASCLAALVYEYFHSLEHSRVELKPGYRLRIRQHHIAHHYFNEQGNYGIVTGIMDRLWRTALVPGTDRSLTVHNLGYRDGLRAKYPYIDTIERAHGNGPLDDGGCASVPESP